MDSFYRIRVTVFTVDAEPPPEFQRAVSAMSTARVRPDIELTVIPAPKRVAPFGYAVEADIVTAPDIVGSGRFILLHDPAGVDAWAGMFRIVTYASASMDSDIAEDDCLAGVGWSWLTDALAMHNAQHDSLGGTVTRVYNDSFGDLAEHPSGIDVQLRASWTPHEGDVGAHLVAWLDALCVLAGLPPMPPGVATLHRGAPR